MFRTRAPFDRPFEHSPGYPPPVTSRGILFVALAMGLGGIALAAARAGVWVIAVAALALAVWMADLARRDLRPR